MVVTIKRFLSYFKDRISLLVVGVCVCVGGGGGGGGILARESAVGLSIN